MGILSTRYNKLFRSLFLYTINPKVGRNRQPRAEGLSWLQGLFNRFAAWNVVFWTKVADHSGVSWLKLGAGCASDRREGRLLVRRERGRYASDLLAATSDTSPPSLSSPFSPPTRCSWWAQGRKENQGRGETLLTVRPASSTTCATSTPTTIVRASPTESSRSPLTGCPVGQ